MRNLVVFLRRRLQLGTSNTVAENIQLEDGSNILLEDGSFLLLE